MNLYIWQSVSGVTEYYHSEAGLAVVAETEDDARALVQLDGREIKWAAPSAVIRVADDTAPIAWIFPDAGCC